MIGTWLVDSNHIAIQCENKIIHPDAQEMYRNLAGEDLFSERGIEIIPLREAFPEAYFSEIGSPIKCIIEDDAEGKLHLRLCCFREQREIDVDIIDGEIIDHCFSENEWFYVVGDTEELQTIFHETGIKSNGDITVSEYIKIIRNCDVLSADTLICRVKISALDKPVIADESIPPGLHAELYEYQKTGYLWMKYMLSENRGCILGDEMGLGKTLQILVLVLEYLHQNKTPALVIAPVSLLENWKTECEKFVPEINAIIHHGSQRTGRYTELLKYDLVIVSYNTAVSDLSILNMIDWAVVVVDEAQNIKNPESNRARSIKRVRRKAGIAVTGTPFENHVTDIWSIVDFVSPGLFGTLSEYKKYISDDINGAKKVEPMLSPIMIRRRVDDVAKDLPERIMVPQPLAMSEEEACSYEALRISAGYSAESSKFGLDILQRLRMFCTHPAICTDTDTGDPAAASVKYQRMCEILEEIFSLGEKVILFTSFQKMFDILENDIPSRFGIPVFKINGSTPVSVRQETVNEFSGLNGSSLLVLNPRAAGTGLNITAANHVIHYNLEWNPAVEDQGSARSYRKGQQKTVFIYRLFYVNTVEQIMNERIEQKREIGGTAVVGIDGKEQNKKDILAALSISPIGGRNND